MKTGTAELPLHYGKAPSWLFQRMKRLAREITLVIIKEYSPKELLNRLSDPFWFQAFGCVLGFDWHSSGLTTTVCGALKEGIKDIEYDIGFFVAGGKGNTARKTPQEIDSVCNHISLQAGNLITSSKLSAKVDNTALQDGYQLYHHVFCFTQHGEWCVVQQGMNTCNRYARRYHWLGKDIKSFVCEPHKAICCDHSNKTLNMVARESEECQKASVTIAQQKPEATIAEIHNLKKLKLPRHHQILLSEIDPKRLNKIFIQTYENQPRDFKSLLGIKGVGPKTIRALSLLSELIYGTKASVKDPVRFSFAHGGKDGHPYPVDRKTYDASIEFLRKSLAQSKIGRSEKLTAFKRLNKLAS